MMLPTIEAKRDDVAALCRRLGVRRLDLFGSAARAEPRHEPRDLDFVVAFDDLTPVAYADAYFALKEGLEALFSAPVDLVTESSLANPHLRARIEAERQALYVA